MDHSQPFKLLAELITVGSISLYPGAEVFFAREEIALRGIALPVRENEVVSEVQRIESPRHEVVYVGLLERFPTVKAKVPLKTA